MNIQQTLKAALLMATTLLIFGCGGGDGGSTTPVNTASGVVQAGLIKNGTVKVYGVDAGGVQTLLTQTTTDANGRYSANLGSYSGAVVIKAYGSYLDEATGQTVTLTEAQALQAALPSVTGAVTVNATPLTDMAVRKAEAAGGIAANIAAANQTISAVFGVDCIKTAPVPPTTTGMASTTATAEQKNYTAVLLMISQYVANNSATPATPTVADLQNALAQIAAGITTTAGVSEVTTPMVALNMQDATADIATNPNTSALVTAGGTAIQPTMQEFSTVGNTAGSQLTSFSIRTAGTGTLYGVQLTVGIPTGVTIRSDANDSMVTATGTATGGLADGVVNASVMTIGVSKAEGFAIGEFATIYVDVPTGQTVTAASFTPVNLIKASDAIGAAIAGITVEVF